MRQLINLLPFLQKEKPLNAYDEFLMEFPAYATTSALDDLRKTDFHKLDVQEHVYLILQLCLYITFTAVKVYVKTLFINTLRSTIYVFHEFLKHQI